MDKNIILNEIKKVLVDKYPDYIDKVILYGSRSRGDEREDSDYDILIILNKDYDWQFERKISSLTYGIDLKYDIFTDVSLISKKELNTIKGKQPFVINALEEGIAV